MQGGNVNPCIATGKVGSYRVKYGLERWGFAVTTLLWRIFHQKQLFP